MTLRPDNPQDDEISKLLDKMYEELMMKRIEYSEFRRKGDPNLEDKLNYIMNLEEDFHSMLKSHTAYWKFKKATGQIQTNLSDALLAKIRNMESNMGQIVSDVPKN